MGTQAYTFSKGGDNAIIKACIFDVDGTILDTEILYTKAIDSVLEEFGAKLSLELKRKMMGRSNTDATKILLDETKIPLESEEYLRRVDKVKFEIFKEATLMPGAERLIRHLHRNNIPISIATSSYRTFYEVKITNHTELFSLFGENVICGDDPKIKNPKPHPDIFHCSRDLLDSTIKDEECLVFEDAINGVRSGVSAQMKVVWIPDARFIDIDNFPPDNYGAHEVINSLSDFIPEKYGLPPFQD